MGKRLTTGVDLTGAVYRWELGYPDSY